jgi:hypothetical protein
MQAADAPAWIGAILLIGGVVVAAVINPPVGGVAAVLGAGMLWVARRREASEHGGNEDGPGTGPGMSAG